MRVLDGLIDLNLFCDCDLVVLVLFGVCALVFGWIDSLFCWLW